MLDKKYLLNDQQMRDFIINGYVTLKTVHPTDFHEAIFQQTEVIFEKEGNPGNNLVPRIPEIQEIFDHPVVDGALTSLVGPSYYTHPHRHCHYNRPGSDGQNLHKDSWTRRHHHTRWVMALYYPQDTPEELGPTGVVPESQYYNSRPNNGKAELPLCGDAGTITIVHYDLWHRAMPNHTDKNRYMMKFLFARMEEPQYPTWNSENTEWQPTYNGGDAMWHHLWKWHTGEQNEVHSAHKESVADHIEALRSEPEPTCLNAAYTLGKIGEPALPALIETLHDESEAVQRNASYALRAIGAPAVADLITVLDEGNGGVRASAVDVLGDMVAPAQEAVSTLIKALQDESEAVRRCAAEGLGIIRQSPSTTVPALARALDDPDEWVRRNTSLALARIGSDSEDAIPTLKAALKDENRYVRANAAHALHRIGTPKATAILMRFLTTSRWCSSTTPQSAY